MARQNIYKHTSRSYFDIYNALVSAYPRKPTWMFKEMAGLFDFSSELINRIATDILYPVTRESAYSFAANCDYDPSEADGATDTITFTLTGAMAKTLPIGYQVGGISASTGALVLYELTAVGDSGGTSSIVVAAKQKKTVTSKLIGQVENDEDFWDYPIDGYTKIINTSISLTIDSLTWTRVDNFDNSESTDRHFKLVYQSSGRARVQFGDGTNGLKPTQNSAIYATFEVTEGLSGRMEAGEITVNVGADSSISSLTNAGSSGGNNAESVASIIRNARANVRLRTMVWSKEDLETAARAASSSVIKALGIPAVGSASIQIIPSGGGNPSGALKTTVDTYVTALTQFGIMPVTVSDPTYSNQNIAATITVRDDYVEATVIDLVEFAMTMATSSYDNQVIESFEENGIDKCRTDVINILWAWAFTSSENDALEFIIEKWIALLGDREYREWGQALEVGDLWIMGNDLYDYGVDVFSLTSPVANVTVTSIQIIGTGTVTIST
jgi:hypothetical protein